MSITATDDFTLADLIPVLDVAIRSQEVASGKILDDPNDPSSAASLYRDASERMDSICSDSPDSGYWACRSGCSACCHQSVPVTAVEALAIADLIRDTTSPQEQKAVVVRLRQNAKRYRSSAPFGSSPVECALLDERGTCTVHPARPLRGRGYYSFSATKCAAFRDGSDEETVPVDPHTSATMRGVQAGLSGAIRNRGRDGDYYELHSAVLCALETPDARARWENSESIFADCTSPAAAPDDVWIAPQEDGSVVKLCRTCDGRSKPRLQLVLIGESEVFDQLQESGD